MANATRQQRLSDACEQCASQIGLIVQVTGKIDEGRLADLIYQYMRNFLHSEGENS